MSPGTVELHAGTSLDGDFVAIAEQDVSTLFGIYNMNERQRSCTAEPDIEYTVPLAAEGVETRLASGPSNPRSPQGLTVGIVLNELNDGCLAAILDGIESESLQAGYQPFALSRQGPGQFFAADYRSHFRRQNAAIEGLFLSAVDNEPAVAVSHRPLTTWSTTIEVDHELGAELALKHLADLGHRRIVFVSGENDISNVSSCRSSLLYVAKTLGLEICEMACRWPIDSDQKKASIHPVLRLLVTQRADITAICCSDATIAVAALQAASDAGLSCPEDLSVMCLNGIQGEVSADSCLTTIRQPLRRMGSLAARVLLEQVRYPRAKFCKSILMQPNLAVRASTGPASFNRDPLGKAWFGPSLANY